MTEDKQAIEAIAKTQRGCNLNPCDNNFHGDITKPMCYVCGCNLFVSEDTRGTHIPLFSKGKK